MKSKLKKILALMFVFLAQITFGQENSVTGIVTDTKGEALVGVSILVKGTNTGTQTDFDGKFTVKAKPTDSLVFSYIGMIDQTLLSSNVANVKMQDDATQLEAVVITTALGIKREKKSLGYATQDLKGDVINKGGANNAISALSGNVAGLQVIAPSSIGGSTRIVLRGVGSVTGENRPLIVIDGIPLDNSNYNGNETERGGGGRDYGDASSDINPNDIESITVLKGGPAAALYGSRAGNGAILYITKSGKKGASRAEIEFNTGLTLESAYISPRLQNLYGGGNSTTFETANINGQTFNIADYATDESWGPKYDPNLKYLGWNSFDPEFPNDYLKERSWIAPKNNVDSFFNTGITRVNSISFTQSSQDAGIRLSFTNANTQGIVPNSELDKNTFSLNANAKLGEKLKIEGMATYVQTIGFNRPEVGYGDNSLAQKFYHFGQRQLDYMELKDYKLANGQQRTWNRTAFDDATPNYSDNLYWTINENISNDKRNRLYGNAKLTYNITPELYAVGNVYADTYSLNINERVAVGSQAQSSFATSTRTFTDFNYEGRLHFDKKISKFSLNSFVGANRRNSNLEIISGQTVGGLVLPNLYNLSNSAEPALAFNRDERQRINSIFGFASIGYDDFLYLEVTDRIDWFSTTFKSVNYASVTGSFVFSALTDASWLNFGKIRAGWAQAGNATTAYRLDNYFVTSTPFQGDPRYSNANDSNNKTLTPELKTTKEIGLELSMFDRRLGIDVSYYDALTSELITPIQVDPSTGFNSTLLNAGNLRNKGIEATVNINPIKTEDFKWDISWNFAKNDNKIVGLYEDVQSLQLATAPFRARLLAVVGQQYGQIYGTDFTYDANGNKVVGADGLYVPSAQKALGTITPDYNMGLRNSFSYKDFSLAILFDMQKGGSYFSTSHMWGTYSGLLEATAANGIRENGIINEGVLANGTPNTKVIDARDWAVGHYQTVDKLNVFDADYFKLREITFGYNLPNKFTGPFSAVNLSLFGRNLFVWGLDWNGMDPEMASYGSGNTQGLEGGSLPSTRTYGMNVKFKF